MGNWLRMTLSMKRAGDSPQGVIFICPRKTLKTIFLWVARKHLGFEMLSFSSRGNIIVGKILLNNLWKLSLVTF